MSRWLEPLLLTVVLTARCYDGNDTIRTELKKIGDQLILADTEFICFKDNKPVTNTITISSIEDGGFYKCLLNRENSTLEKDISVIVLHEVSSVDASGDRCPDNSSSMCLTIEEGDNTTLWCNATDGYPLPTVKWFIREGDKKYENGFKDTDLHIEGQLQIRKISYHCDSHLVCKVGNNINEDKKTFAEKSIKVYVGRKPYVVIRTYKDGKLQSSYDDNSICPIDRALFSCVVDTFPSPDVIKWSINDTFSFTWNSTLNYNLSSEMSSNVPIACRPKFDNIIGSVIRSEKVANLLNATIEWGNMNLDCVSFIKCEAVNRFGRDVKTLTLTQRKCNK